LLPKRVMSQSDYDEAAAEYEAASAKVTEKEALIAQKRMVAPFAGVVDFYHKQAGDFVAMGESIITLHQPSPLWVEFELPSEFLASIAVGQKVAIQTPSHPKEIFHATVSLIHPSVQASNRALVLRAEYNNGDARLKPGLFVTLKLSVLPPKEVVMIPETAINYNPYGNFVFKLALNEKKEWQAQKISIETGERENGWVVIHQGLALGDRMVRAGIMKVRDGQVVQLATQKGLNESGVQPE
jgi:membrane fusion protein, multidrug efflux system